MSSRSSTTSTPSLRNPTDGHSPADPSRHERKDQHFRRAGLGRVDLPDPGSSAETSGATSEGFTLLWRDDFDSLNSTRWQHNPFLAWQFGSVFTADRGCTGWLALVDAEPSIRTGTNSTSKRHSGDRDRGDRRPEQPVLHLHRTLRSVGKQAPIFSACAFDVNERAALRHEFEFDQVEPKSVFVGEKEQTLGQKS